MLSRNHASKFPFQQGKQDQKDLAIWILKVCYDQPHPSSTEINRVKNELRLIQDYENESRIEQDEKDIPFLHPLSSLLMT